MRYKPLCKRHAKKKFYNIWDELGEVEKSTNTEKPAFLETNRKRTYKYNNHNDSRFNNQEYQQGANYGTSTRYRRQNSPLTNKAPENQNFRQLRIDEAETCPNGDSEESNDNNILDECLKTGKDRTEPIEEVMLNQISCSKI